MSFYQIHAAHPNDFNNVPNIPTDLSKQTNFIRPFLLITSVKQIAQPFILEPGKQVFLSLCALILNAFERK